MSRRGFTLLEVMVAVAILAIALTAILSSEVGAMRVANRARRTNVATLLARCKMAEVEEQVSREGLPAIDDRGEDECCEDAEVEGYRCEWTIDRIVLPELGVSSESSLGGDEDEEGEEGESPSFDPGSPPSSEEMLAGGGDVDGITQMAMSMAYPSLKPALEERVRRAIVTVKWFEGSREHSFDVVQFLVGDVGTAEDETAETAEAPQ
ncbi:MAG TPA: type II secretion system protein [Planctomycetota bacterium]|nr:type II secretion system protein [Planctomycetota bacterium]